MPLLEIICMRLFNDLYLHLTFLSAHYDCLNALYKPPFFSQYTVGYNAGASNSNCSLGQIKTCKVTRGPHHDADATIAVPELTRNRFYILFPAKRFHEL